MDSKSGDKGRNLSGTAGDNALVSKAFYFETGAFFVSGEEFFQI